MGGEGVGFGGVRWAGEEDGFGQEDGFWEGDWLGEGVGLGLETD